MAVVLAFRIALILAPAGVRIVKWSEGPGVDQAVRLSKALLDRLADPGESDANLTTAVAAESGRVADVATYTGSFELRRLQVKFELLVGGAVVDDARITTYDFLKLASGSPSDAWVAADFTTVENAFGTAWTAIKARYSTSFRLSQYRWYKAGPGIAPPQEPVRVVDNLVVGTAVSGGAYPPQVALACTELTSSRKAWGRVYWPAPAVNAAAETQTDAIGRYTSAILTVYANALDTFYEACRAGNVMPVVFSPAKPSRPTAGGGTLAATADRALTVDTIQVDDVPDVIRSRRLKSPSLKVQRGLT